MERAVNFPQNVPYGTTHFELGRTFEYVKPGMWKSIGGSGSGGGGLDDAPDDGQIYARQSGAWVLLPPEEDPTVPDHVKAITEQDIDRWNNSGGGGGGGSTDWPDITNKPKPITDLAGDYHPQKVSILSGGNY